MPVKPPASAKAREIMPRSIFNCVLIILVVTVGRAALASIFLVPPSTIEFIGVPTAIGLSAFLFKILPDASRSWTEDHARSLISSRHVTQLVTILLCSVLLVSVSLARVQIFVGRP